MEPACSHQMTLYLSRFRYAYSRRSAFDSAHPRKNHLRSGAALVCSKSLIDSLEESIATRIFHISWCEVASLRMRCRCFAILLNSFIVYSFRPVAAETVPKYPKSSDAREDAANEGQQDIQLLVCELFPYLLDLQYNNRKHTCLPWSYWSSSRLTRPYSRLCTSL